MVIYLSRGQNDAEISIQLPAKPDTVWPIITQLDECGISAGPVKIVGAACPIPQPDTIYRPRRFRAGGGHAKAQRAERDDRALGVWLVEHGLAGVDFSETVRPYLDYANHGGVYTPHGYVKRREPVQEQAAEIKNKFTLTLISASGTYRISLPAPDSELEQARQALKVRSLDSVIYGGAEITYPWAHLLPMDSITLKDANNLARFARK